MVSLVAAKLAIVMLLKRLTILTRVRPSEADGLVDVMLEKLTTTSGVVTSIEPYLATITRKNIGEQLDVVDNLIAATGHPPISLVDRQKIIAFVTPARV